MNARAFVRRVQQLVKSDLTHQQLIEMRIAAPVGLERDALGAACVHRGCSGNTWDRARKEEEARIAVAEHTDTTAFDVDCAREDEEAEHRNWVNGEVAGSAAYRFRDDETEQF